MKKQVDKWQEPRALQTYVAACVHFAQYMYHNTFTVMIDYILSCLCVLQDELQPATLNLGTLGKEGSGRCASCYCSQICSVVKFIVHVSGLMILKSHNYCAAAFLSLCC